MSDAAPGWYPDNGDPTRERWWDGHAWSPVTRPAPPAPRGVVGGLPGGEPVTPAQPGPYGPYGSPYAGPATNPYGTPQGTPYGTPQGTPQGTPYGTPYAPTGYGQAVRKGPRTPDGVAVSAPGWRLLARVIDSLIVSTLSLLPGFTQVRAIFRVLQDLIPPVGSSGTFDPVALYTNAQFVSAATNLSLIELAVGAVYTVGFLGWRGATPGKMAAGIRVRPWAHEAVPSWNQAGLRWLTSNGIGALPGIGIFWSVIDTLWLLWDPRRQALHDKLPRTVVVRGR